MDNVLPNWGDELAGGLDAAAALVTGKPVGEAFKQGQADFKAHQAQYDDEHPNLAWTSTLGGIGASLLLPGGALAKGAGMGAKIAQGAKIGAIYGGLSGAGEGDSVADRVDSAIQSAVAGAALGGLATPALEGAALAHRWARGKLPGYDGATRRLANVPRAVLRKSKLTKEARAREVADRTLSQRLGEGNIVTGMGQNGPAASPETIAAELERRQAMGVPAMPGDITESLRNTTSWASRGMGPGQRLVRSALDARKAQEAARVRQHVIDTMGSVTDPLAQIERQTAAAKARVAPLYREAYAQPMVITPEIEAIMATPAFKDALPQAYRNIGNAIGDPEAMGLRMRQDGTIDPEAMQSLSTEGFDQVIRAMRDNGRAAAGINPRTGQPVHNTNSVHINARAGDLRDQLAAQNEAYGDAIRLYADDMAQRDALEAGGRVAGLSGHEVNEMARSIPETAHESWALGARSALADEATDWGAQHQTGNVSARIRGALGDQTKQDAIGRMGGNSGAVRQLLDRLEAEHQGNILWSEAQGNSATAGRQALDADLNEQIAPTLPTGWKAMAGRALAKVGEKAGGEFRNGVKDRTAQVLTEQDPKAFRGHLDDIAGLAERDAQQAAYRHRNATLLAKAAALNIEPATEDGQVLLGVGENPGGRGYGMYGRYEDNFDAEGNPL
ncbi:hypothetical protein H5V43_16300 [Sphingobium fuliginis]|uniref:Uncharacterized protein n=2 Tax=Sphingobium fuliginis (strain ATCC 27551) TaxID=336203 RepID=A0A7M2GHM4_SPHSA|nr:MULTISPECIES: hypothetical protein [Sphingobium]QOT71602.1 hypothetical protein H5V43_16300 [Sphingobium fuliginis]